jgi:anti-sigma regulatory factor (Ser/Thr protein kinase)
LAETQPLVLPDEALQGRRNPALATVAWKTSQNAAQMSEHQSLGWSDGSLPAPAGPVQQLIFTAESLQELRHFLADWAEEERLGAERVQKLVLAVNELATNSVRHGGGGGTLRVWREAATLLCEIHDDGYIEQPLPGGTLPGPDARGGRGLWLVNELCDLVQIRYSAAGTVVRVHTRLP